MPNETRNEGKTDRVCRFVDVTVNMPFDIMQCNRFSYQFHRSSNSSVSIALLLLSLRFSATSFALSRWPCVFGAISSEPTWMRVHRQFLFKFLSQSIESHRIRICCVKKVQPKCSTFDVLTVVALLNNIYRFILFYFLLEFVASLRATLMHCALNRHPASVRAYLNDIQRIPDQKCYRIRAELPP